MVCFYYTVPPSFLLGSKRVVTNVLSEKVTLSCTVNGLPAPNITWFDTMNEKISNGDRILINTTHIIDTSGLVEVTSTLEILNPQNMDGGIYQCTADNGISLLMNMTIILLVLGIIFVCTLT